MSLFRKIAGRTFIVLFLALVLSAAAFLAWAYGRRGKFLPKHREYVRFALCQYSSRKGDVLWGLHNAMNFASEAVRHGADVVVLPEFSFTTVHDIRTQYSYFNISDRPEYLGALADFTLRHGCYLMYNHPFTTNAPSATRPLHFNVSYVMGPDGQVMAEYRKQAMALLDTRCKMKPGNKDMIVSFPFGDVGMMICKDSCYPQHFMSYTNADLVVIQFAHIAHWGPNPAPRGLQEPIAEVVDNLARNANACTRVLGKPLLMVNKTGMEDEYGYIGGSRVVVANGTALTVADSGPEIIYADFPLDENGRIDRLQHPAIPEKPEDYPADTKLRKHRRSLYRLAERLPVFHSGKKKKRGIVPTPQPLAAMADEEQEEEPAESAEEPAPPQEEPAGSTEAPSVPLEATAALPGGMRPERIPADVAPGPSLIAGREVLWYEHAMDPAWGCEKPERRKHFAVLLPKGGAKEGSPLILELHSHGYNAVKLVKTLDVPGDHDIWKAPDEFFQLVPDCSPRPPQDSPDFWWCCANHYETPSPADLARTGLDLSACEKRVLDTLEWTIRTYGIDRDRVYVCGNSMGGQGAMGIGLNHGDIFAAIKANVPAGVWFASTRMGMTDAEGRDVPLEDIPFGRFPDPPVCIDYSSPADDWSKDHEVLFRNMARCRYPFIAYWGNFRHANDDRRILHCNDIVHSFDWLSVRRNEAYAVFTNASCDDTPPWGRFPDAGSDRYTGDIAPGQVNAYFRWKAVEDTPESFAMDLWIVSPEELGSTMFTPPETATADVTPRRLQSFPRIPGGKYLWSFGEQSGEITADQNGLLTFPALELTAGKKRLLISVAGDR